MPQHVLRHLVRRTRYVLVIVANESGIRHRVPFLAFGKARANRLADRMNRDAAKRYTTLLTHWEVEPDGGVDS